MVTAVDMLPDTSAGALTGERLASVQSAIGLLLPDTYLQFLRATNGGVPRLDTLTVYGRDIVIDRFLSIVDDYRNSDLGFYDVEVVWSQVEDRLGDRLVPIATTFGGDLLCLNYSDKSEPTVILWDHEKSATDQPITYPVADSFAALTEMVSM